MKNDLFQNMNWALLQEQKQELVRLSMTECFLSKRQYEALDGVINLIDALQDQAVDALGLQESEVFNLKTYSEK